MIQCVDIGNLEIRDMNLKESKREFIDILHELGHGYNEKESQRRTSAQIRK